MILYKYIDENILKVLETFKLKFSQREQLNDPFEFDYNFIINEADAKSITDKMSEEQKKHFTISSLKNFSVNINENRYQENENYLNQNSNNLSFEINKEEIKKYILKVINSLMVALCFTEDPLNIPMWSHYAKSHTGFVIGFDADSCFEDINSNKFKKVKYMKKRPKLNIYNEEVIKDKLLFIKSSHWEYEKEWRLVELTENVEVIKNEGQNIFLSDFNPASIKEIYFGIRSNSEISLKIMEIIKNSSELRDVKLFKMELDKSEFKLTKRPINIFL